MHNPGVKVWHSDSCLMAVYALINRINLIIIIAFFLLFFLNNKMGMKQMTENVSFNSFLHTQSALTTCK